MFKPSGTNYLLAQVHSYPRHTVQTGNDLEARIQLKLRG